MLNERGLNKDEISKPFICGISNSIPLTIKGKDALQTRMNNEKFSVQIKSTDGMGIVNIISNSVDLDITYKTPTNFAKIQNGIVTNTIVAEPEFIGTYAGQWVEIPVNAGIGYSYDGLYFMPPKPYGSWVYENNKWVAPVPYPNDGLNYAWNESQLSWVKFN